MTLAVISQPTYLPWLGYFEQLVRADVFVFLDNVQFARRSWQCRNRLKGANNQPFWLTVPVKDQPRDTLLCDVMISTDQPHWRRDHLRSIQMHLGKTPHFDRVFPQVQSWLETPTERLADLNIAGIRMLADMIGLERTLLRASELKVAGKRTELLVNICKEVGAGHYYTAAGAEDYLQEEMDLFRAAGIPVAFQTWEHPVYPQRGEGFVSHLCALDALCNAGPQAVRDFLRITP